MIPERQSVSYVIRIYVTISDLIRPLFGRIRMYTNYVKYICGEVN